MPCGSGQPGSFLSSLPEGIHRPTIVMNKGMVEKWEREVKKWEREVERRRGGEAEWFVCCGKKQF